MIVSEDDSLAYHIFTFYLPLFFCVVSIIGGVIFIITHFKFVRMRLYSGRLFLHVTIIQIALSLVFGLSLFYMTVDQQVATQNESDNHTLFIVNQGESVLFGVIGFHISICYFLYHFFISHNLYKTSTLRHNISDTKHRIQQYVLLTQLIAFPGSIIAAVCD